MPCKKDFKKQEQLLNSPDEKTEDDLKFLREFDEKVELYNNPPLSKTAISSLIKQYGWIVYNKKTAQKGDAMSFLKKGTDMESEAVQLLSKIDKSIYRLETENAENDYLVGRGDIICHDKDKVIDIKISWNVNSFLKSRTTPLSSKYWYQMQGYMELYNVNKAEVVFLLLNTPPELIEREKIKLINRFMIGEIDRDKYEIDMGNIESSFTYSNLPISKRHFRYVVNREPKIFERVYKSTEKARVWLSEFDKEMKSNILFVPSEKYFVDTEEEDNT